MITITYDNETKVITASMDKNSYYASVYLESGTYNQRKNCSYFPMNDVNINILYKRYNDGMCVDGREENKIIWKNSLREGVLQFLSDKIKDSTMMSFLTTLTLDNVHTFPYLYDSKAEDKPFKNQHVSQYWGHYMPHHALLWEMGTGKTRAAIEMFMIKKENNEVNRGLVICPLSMVNKWVVEIEKWSNTRACPFLGVKEEKLETLTEDWDWIVVTYESFERYKDQFLEIVDLKRFVILDETTKIKNPRAKRTKAVFELGLKVKHKVILTGTPVTQHAYDVFSQFRFLDNGETFGFNYDQFIDRYFWRRGFKLIPKTGAVKEISDKIYHKSTRFLKKDCIDIPDKVYDQRLLDMPAYNLSKYKEMVQWAITQIEGSDRVTAPVILTQLLRLSQITSGFIKDVSGQEKGFAENPKMDALKDILENSNGSKIVVWARFQYDVEQIEALCQKMEIKAVTIYGKDSVNVRTENVRLFQEEEETKVIIGTASTGGHGIDLTSANIVVYYSNSYSLEQRLQSEDRAHRAGQKNQVTYIDLLCKDTIDVSIYKILRAKKNIADMVTRDNLRGIL
jgi:SNF2 family DNA or RNA helicase